MLYFLGHRRIMQHRILQRKDIQGPGRDVVEAEHTWFMSFGGHPGLAYSGEAASMRSHQTNVCTNVASIAVALAHWPKQAAQKKIVRRAYRGA